jgi:hypothetical protein
MEWRGMKIRMEAPVQSEAERIDLSIDFAKEKNDCPSVFY